MTGIVRKWEASIARADIARWRETFMERAFPTMRKVEGFRGIRVIVGRDTDPCRITVLTSWSSMDAVRRYAGDTTARTVMPDFMARFFPDYDAEATFHDEILVEAP